MYIEEKATSRFEAIAILLEIASTNVSVGAIFSRGINSTDAISFRDVGELWLERLLSRPRVLGIPL